MQCAAGKEPPQGLIRGLDGAHLALRVGSAESLPEERARPPSWHAPSEDRPAVHPRARGVTMYHSPSPSDLGSSCGPGNSIAACRRIAGQSRSRTARDRSSRSGKASSNASWICLTIAYITEHRRDQITRKSACLAWAETLISASAPRCDTRRKFREPNLLAYLAAVE